MGLTELGSLYKLNGKAEDHQALISLPGHNLADRGTGAIGMGQFYLD